MKKYLEIFLLSTVCFCCNSKIPSTYFWITFHGHEYEKKDTITIKSYSKSTRSDTTQLSYVYKKGFLNYFITAPEKNSFISQFPRDIVNPDDSLTFMRHLTDTSINFNATSYKVSKYIINESGQDGASIHYYEPSVGVFAAHSDTWPGIRYLQTSDTLLNRRIYGLIKATVPEFFIRGKLADILK